jgi:hypothetical protein
MHPVRRRAEVVEQLALPLEGGSRRRQIAELEQRRRADAVAQLALHVAIGPADVVDAEPALRTCISERVDARGTARDRRIDRVEVELASDAAASNAISFASPASWTPPTIVTRQFTTG